MSKHGSFFPVPLPLSISVDKWQRDWEQTTKGTITKDYLPKVTDRMKMKISTNQNLTTMMTGHGKSKAYLHRFKLIDSATCPCRDKNDQTIDHILYESEILKTQRDSLKLTVSKTDSWPTNKYTLNKQTLLSIKEIHKPNRF
jgi:hypothetical protein